jgi:hypothetical protein
VCPRGTYGDKGKAAWLRAAPTALLFGSALINLTSIKDADCDRGWIMSRVSSGAVVSSNKDLCHRRVLVAFF